MATTTTTTKATVSKKTSRHRVRSRSWMITTFPPKGSDEDAHPDPLPAYDPYSYNYRGWVEHQCPKTGRYHLHVLILLKEPVTMSQVKEDYGIECHCEVPVDLDKAREYLFKIDDKHLPQDAPKEKGYFHKQGCRTDWALALQAVCNGVTPAEILKVCNASVARNVAALKEIYNNPTFIPRDPLAGVQFYCWQIRCEEILAGPHPARQILWIYSTEYGTGKSHFMQHISTRHKVILGNPDDPRTAAFLIRPDTEIIWFDLDRLFHLTPAFTQQLERLSTGGLVDVSKYTPRQIEYWGHVVVTCNMLPPVEYSDRCLAVEANLIL